MDKKTIIIGGVEYIDASKSDNISAIISGLGIIMSTAFLGLGAIWALIETIIF